MPNSVFPKLLVRPSTQYWVLQKNADLKKIEALVLHQVVSLELLSSLDGLIWLQSGTKVGALFQQHQTTVSRNQKKCANAFGISLYKHKKKWAINGDQTLLLLERKVHQIARLQGKSRLRIDVIGWLDSSIFNPPPSGWIIGSASNLSNPHSLQCLQQRIVDVCLCPLTDLPVETELLKSIELNSKGEIGVVILQEHANQERILDLINMLEQA